MEFLNFSVIFKILEFRSWSYWGTFTFFFINDYVMLSISSALSVAGILIMAKIFSLCCLIALIALLGVANAHADHVFDVTGKVYCDNCASDSPPGSLPLFLVSSHLVWFNRFADCFAFFEKIDHYIFLILRYIKV